jgi:hypothetical protein
MGIRGWFSGTGKRSQACLSEGDDKPFPIHKHFERRSLGLSKEGCSKVAPVGEDIQSQIWIFFIGGNHTLDELTGE